MRKRWEPCPGREQVAAGSRSRKGMRSPGPVEASAQGMTTEDPPGELGRQTVRLSDVGACACQAAGRPGITSPNCNVKR